MNVIISRTLTIARYGFVLFTLAFAVVSFADEELSSPTLVNINRCFPQVAKNISKKISEKAFKNNLYELENIQEELQKFFVFKNKVDGSRYIEFRAKDGIKYSIRATPLRNTSTLSKSRKLNTWPFTVEMFKYKAEDNISNIELSAEQLSLKYEQFIESQLEGVSIIRDETSESFVAYPGGLFKRSKLNEKLVDFELRVVDTTPKKEKMLNCKALSGGYPLCTCKI